MCYPRNLVGRNEEPIQQPRLLCPGTEVGNSFKIDSKDDGGLQGTTRGGRSSTHGCETRESRDISDQECKEPCGRRRAKIIRCPGSWNGGPSNNQKVAHDPLAEIRSSNLWHNYRTRVASYPAAMCCAHVPTGSQITKHWRTRRPVHVDWQVQSSGGTSS